MLVETYAPTFYKIKVATELSNHVMDGTFSANALVFFIDLRHDSHVATVKLSNYFVPLSRRGGIIGQLHYILQCHQAFIAFN